MSNLIYTINNSLDISFCNTLISMYNQKEIKNKIHSSKISGNKIKQKIRNSSYITVNYDLPNIYYNILNQKLKEAFKLYLLHIKNYNINLQSLNNKNLKIMESHISLSKYNKNDGYYTFHNDFNVDVQNGYRLLTFIWYINDVTIGGETEFIDGTKITPKQGKLLIFPSTWTYVHRGNIPISSDKYIIVGWLELYS